MSAEKGRSNRAYRAWRRRYLERHPLCEHCAEVGLTAEATELDHVVPIAKGGELMDERNVQGLCEHCHKRKTAEDFGHRSMADPERERWQARLEAMR